MARGYLGAYLAPLLPTFTEPDVIEVAVNADGSVWIDRAGQVHMAPVHGVRVSAADLAQAIANDAQQSLTDQKPIVSTSIRAEGLDLRVQIVRPPAVQGSTVLSFRVTRELQARQEPKPFKLLRTLDKSLEEERRDRLKAISALAETDTDAFLQAVITERLNVVISGGTSTGKTELGRRLMWMLDPAERVITIEDALELRPALPNLVSLIASRDPARENSADALLRACLRLRPDRIILGELRGSEAATFLAAINTGHSGSFTTLHADSADKALDRLALMVMETGTRLSYPEVSRYIAGAIDVIIQTGRVGDERGIMEIAFPRTAD